MPQAGRPYTPVQVHPTLEQSAIAHRYVQRQGYAAARDACPVEADETAVDAICRRLSAIDREILSIVPNTAAEIALQAAVVLDADADFITDNVRLVLGRMLNLGRESLS